MLEVDTLNVVLMHIYYPVNLFIIWLTAVLMSLYTAEERSIHQLSEDSYNGSELVGCVG